MSGYRPWLDGVRAAAVLMVALQHAAGPTTLDVGFGSVSLDVAWVGVGLFFALSGYLITSLLLDEQALRGTVSLGRFYLRRAARLVPALLLVLAVCDVFFLLRGDTRQIQESLAAATYTTNYAAIVTDRYFGAVGPTWSLAVEEHFYVLWPLGLLALRWRFGLRTALWATLCICLAALLWRTVLALIGAPTLLLGMGSLERADALLYGCAAAIAIRLGWRPQAWMVPAAIAAILVLPLVFTRETYAFLILGNAAIAVAGAMLVVGLDYRAPSRVRRVLSNRALVAIGVLSYGIYLWHVPAMVIAADLGLGGRRWRFVAVVVAIGIAALSHRHVERPIRVWARRRSPGPRPAIP
jgi:peptidoglycan/LPS O-acetylase OafA/YrhL